MLQNKHQELLKEDKENSSYQSWRDSEFHTTEHRSQTVESGMENSAGEENSGTVQERRTVEQCREVEGSGTVQKVEGSGAEDSRTVQEVEGSWTEDGGTVHVHGGEQLNSAGGGGQWNRGQWNRGQWNSAGGGEQSNSAGGGVQWNSTESGIVQEVNSGTMEE